MKKFDIAIVGGGVVGALAALMLSRRQPHARIAVVDAAPAGSTDPRTLALAYKTQQLFAHEGLWQGDLKQQAAPIHHIHVSDRGGAGSAAMHDDRLGVDALGYVVGAAPIQSSLREACEAQHNLEWLAQTRVLEMVQQAQSTRLQLDNDTSLEARLVVAADGAQSVIREQLGIQLETTDYEQVAMIANLEMDRAHAGWAFERFTEHGPIALLPRSGRRMALVWCLPPEQAEATRALQDADFVRSVQQAFGFRAGRMLKVEDRASFPLHLLLAERCIHHRTVILGNACHTLHPIAGQGYNLGVRDVESLVAHLTDGSSEDPGSHRRLLAYERDRQHDYQRITGLTDGMVRLFSNQYPPLVAGRNLGLLALRSCPLLTGPLARTAMGYRTDKGAR
ncbi:2-octaprenyl-6-methoxyphenyl hydroxylase [Aliidiomarina sp. Khilg15.8]